MEKAVVVIGGGIGGVQAALDLAESGLKVHLVEREGSIGGEMARLDKTFPTNDCSMCILSPKLVEVGRHANISLHTNTRVMGLEGKPGAFRIRVIKDPRYIDEERCLGCGKCAEKCPVKVPNEFDEGMAERRAAYVQFPQAVPLVYKIDPVVCLYINEGRCGVCAKVCPAEAVDFDQEEEELELRAGAVIMAPGFQPFGPSGLSEYGHGRYKNVLTSIEFERMLNASGPTMGSIARPSDGEHPRRIAFIQCVGSRDSTTAEYCSAVCCMFAIKEAVIAKEHAPYLEELRIFYIDLRTSGKEFEDYRIRAEREHGVTFTRCKVPAVSEDPRTTNLFLRYVDDEEGELREAEFDLVVLSTGLRPPKDAEELARVLDIELDEHGFCATDPFAPLESSRPGVLVCGAFSGPKDIPETVAQASGTAAKASVAMGEGLERVPIVEVLPTPAEVEGEEPRVGVFVCHCGNNIGGVVDVPAVVEHAKGLPGVVFAEDNLYSCSQDAQEHIKERIKEQGLNRVVVSSCTPRTHEPLFRNTVREAGLNEYLFEMANIRDQCSWVHMSEPELATEKSKELVQMAVAKALLLESLERPTIPVVQRALVLGGGATGMTAALDIADQGFATYIVEREDELGGMARRLGRVGHDTEVQAELAKLVKRVQEHPRVEVFTGAEVEDIEGTVGNFRTTLKGVDAPLEHGVVIVATGGVEHEPDEYLYGQDPRVVTQLGFEEELEGSRPKDLPASVVFIQCVGSRNEERPWCSRICCTASIRQALRLKVERPDAHVHVIYRDVRTPGSKELGYKEASARGINFIRFEPDEPPVVTRGRSEDDPLKVEVLERLIGARLELDAERVVLATAILPPEGNDRIARMLKVPLSKDGFFLEAHMKLRPVDFATDGIFLAGLAHSPKFIDESIAQASAAASRAVTILSKDTLVSEGIVSVVDEDACTGCGTCIAVCPYGAIERTEAKKARVVEVMCKGCGVCASNCPEQAIDIRGFTEEQLIAQVDAMMKGGS